MTGWPTLVGLMAVAVLLAWGARRLRVPIPIVLVLGGLVLGFIDGVPRITVDPRLILVIVLPAVLYQAAIFTPWRSFRANLRAISFLAFGLVIATTCAIALAVHTLIPGMPWVAAFVLGAIVSPPDAVAATAIFSRLRINRRTVTILEGESLVNDATGLVVYKFAVAAVLTGTFSPGQAALEFLGVAAGGAALGVALGYLAVQLQRAIKDSLIEIALSIVLAYAIYLAAEAVHLSGVLAVVAAGLVRGWHAPEAFSAQTRLQANAVWETLVFSLNSFVFILIGLELQRVFEGLAGYGTVEILGYSLAISGVAIVVRFAWVFPGLSLQHWLHRRSGGTEPGLGWRNMTIMSWCGMRGIVSLAAALALPYLTDGHEGFPDRSLIIFLTFVLILVTLVFQGLTLAPLIRWLKVGAPSMRGEEENLARLKIAYAAIEEIDRVASSHNLPPESTQPVRAEYAARLTQEQLAHRGPGRVDEATRVLRLAAITAERRRLVKLHRERQIGDEVLHRVQHELDLEELRLIPQGGVDPV
jgi:CPA1 family monovalent cation:H+ antiporter